MTDLRIPGVRLTPLEVLSDDRGFFAEVARAGSFPNPFAQMNVSSTLCGALRGLHYHRRQSDVWFVVSGRAQVGLADLRSGRSELNSAAFELSGDRPQVLYIPPGVAHGYLALTDLMLVYLVSREFDGSDEHGVAWNDPTIGIPWAIDRPILSARDGANPELRWEEILPSS